MRRRNFLHTAGVLFPAVVFASPSVFAGQGAVQSSMIMITGNTSADSRIPALVKEAARSVQQIAGEQVSSITYKPEGFAVRTRDGRQFSTSKLVLNAAFAIDLDKLAVEISTEHENHTLAYNSGRNKKVIRPELWSLRPDKLESRDILPFIKRKKHAFLCISA